MQVSWVIGWPLWSCWRHAPDRSMAMAEDAAKSCSGASRATRRALRRLHDVMDAFEAQLQCPICLCAYSTPASLPCHHCFCEECIHRALELKQVCPICKAPAKKRQLRHDTMLQQLQQAAELWTSVPLALELVMRDGEESDREELQATPEAHELSHVAAATESKADVAATAQAPTTIRINPFIASETSSRRRRRQEDEPMEAETSAEDITVNGERLEYEDASEDEEDDDDSDSDVIEVQPPVQQRLKRAAAEETEEIPAPKKRAIDANGHSEVSNGHSASNGHAEPEESGPTFQVGQLVEVIDRTWRGINKPGGAAWITKVHGDGTYDVRYIIGTRRENAVPDQYILTPKDEIVSFASPGRAVKQHRRKPTKNATPPSVDLLRLGGVVKPPRQSDLVFLCSGYTEEGNDEIRRWAAAMGAEVVDHWSQFVTHLIAKCATPQEAMAAMDDDLAHGEGAAPSSSRKRSLFKEEKKKRWVKIRSMKYLKALVAGRWIVSETWLRDCARQSKRLAESAYEADGHMKAQNVSAACQRSRAMREESLCALGPEVNPLTVGTRLFADLCFHIYGEFLPPMPPPAELDMLIRLGDGKVFRFLDDIAMEMEKEEHKGRTLVIVCDKLNQQMLRRTAKELTALPQLHTVPNKHVVSYQWILNSISEAKLRQFG